MIYTRWGFKGKIVADHGQHKVVGYGVPVRLVAFNREEDGRLTYEFTFNLRADGGANEIEAAADAALKETLMRLELLHALEDAM